MARTISSLTKQIFNWAVALACIGFVGNCRSGELMNAEEYFAPAVVELLDSIQGSDKAKAKALIDSGVTLNSHGNEGVTPLLWLITQRDQQAVELALTLGADPNFPALVEINRSGPKPAQPLALIAGNGDNLIFKLLLEHGANPNSIDQSTGHPAIFNVITFENTEQFDLLVKNGVDLDITDRNHANSALYAADIGKYNLVYQLLTLGASPNMPSNTGATIAWRIYSAFEKKEKNPAFRISDDMRKTKELLIEKGVKFPPLSPREVRERLARGETLSP